MLVKMKKFFSVLAVLAVLAPVVAGAQEEVTKDTLLRANTDTLMKHVRILASSQYEGRMAGSQAYLDAADYCAGVDVTGQTSTYGSPVTRVNGIRPVITLDLTVPFVSESVPAVTPVPTPELTETPTPTPKPTRTPTPTTFR